VKKIFKKISFCLILSIQIWSCKPDDNLPTEDNEELLEIPVYFPKPHYQFTTNKITSKGIELGRRIFYDPILSADSTISCASCHHQNLAFTDGKALSTGFQQRLGRRNSPPLQNLIWNTSFNWDGGINHIEIFSLAPITDANEMNLPLKEAIDKLNRNPKYSNDFYEVFGAKPIDDQQLFYALTQFMGTLISANSKYDKYIEGESTLSQEELAGYMLFKQHCNSCHTEPLFTNYGFFNNGNTTAGADSGRFRITLNPTDFYKFRTPSLRNIMQTAPYMHNGSIASLKEVVERYANPTKLNTENLDPRISTITLSEKEKENLLKFLATLSDIDFMSNPKFANPY
jgi:cytochrome c peroxidase